MVSFYLNLLTKFSGNLLQGCKTAGVHFNPFGVVHGGPQSEIRHVGDLGNLEADQNGVAFLDFYDRMIDLSGKYSIIGRSMIVHSNADDFGLGENLQSTLTGNSGTCIASCVIGLSQSF